MKWPNLLSSRLLISRILKSRYLNTFQYFRSACKGLAPVQLLSDPTTDRYLSEVQRLTISFPCALQGTKPPDLSPRLESSRRLFHALLAEILEYFEVLNSPTLCTLCNNNLSTTSLSLQTLRLHSACTLLARLLYLTYTFARMRTMLSLLILQRQTLTSVNAHLADGFTALLVVKLLLM